MRLRSPRWPTGLVLPLGMLLLLLGACAPQSLLIRGVADTLAASGTGDGEEDLLLARDAAPVMLKASEAVLTRTPDHLRLAATVAGGFTQYAYAFVAFEAERLNATDARAAQRLRERAARLYHRAHRHAMRALVMHRSVLVDPSPAAMAAALASDDEVAVAYWAAASWAAWISLSKNDPDVVADLPRAMRLARLAYEQRPDHGRGALASLMGTLEAARPGGSLAQAQQYFDRALAVAGPDDPSVLLAMAEAVVLPAGDRERFELLLRRALESDQRRPELAAQVMRERARWLLQSLDELF